MGYGKGLGGPSQPMKFSVGPQRNMNPGSRNINLSVMNQGQRMGPPINQPIILSFMQNQQMGPPAPPPIILTIMRQPVAPQPPPRQIILSIMRPPPPQPRTMPLFFSIMSQQQQPYQAQPPLILSVIAGPGGQGYGYSQYGYGQQGMGGLSGVSGYQGIRGVPGISGYQGMRPGGQQQSMMSLSGYQGAKPAQPRSIAPRPTKTDSQTDHERAEVSRNRQQGKSFPKPKRPGAKLPDWVKPR